ncbi:MAG: DUF4328 domain-containing protein [Planctomycetaceae bacterium]
MQSGQVRGYESMSSLVKVVTVLMAIYVLMTIVSIGSSLLQLSVLNQLKAGVDVPEEILQMNDLREFVIAITFMGVFIALAICFLRWVYRANRNAQALVRSPLTISPGWSVGWYFVPIMNLFKPYQAVKEIWQASTPAVADWRKAPVSPIVGFWWTFWILDNIASQASVRLSFRADDVSELITSTGVDIGSSAIGIPSAVLALLLVRNLHNMQEQKSVEEPVGVAHSCPSCGEEFTEVTAVCPVCGARCLT